MPMTDEPKRAPDVLDRLKAIRFQHLPIANDGAPSPAEIIAEVARLRAVEASLPKTADGVTVTFGQNVYLNNHDSRYECRSIAPEIIGAGFIGFKLDEDRDGTVMGRARTEQGWEFWLDVALCYSTESAALAATPAAAKGEDDHAK